MGTFREFPVFWSALAACVLAGLALAWQCRGLRAQAGRWQQRLVSERRERQALEAQVLLAAAEGREQAAAIERERQARREAWVALARGDAARSADAPAPGTRTAACAALAAMADELRALAKGQGIVLAPDEGFGFAEFARTGPATDQLAEVHRQSRIVDVAVRLLVVAQPAAILAVSRGRAPGPVDGVTSAAGLAGRTAVRLEFSGHTPVLRAFLNGLARSELLLRVSSVEAKPARTDAAAAEGASAVPWLAPGLMDFAVTLECVHLAPGADGVPAIHDKTEGPAPAVWLESGLSDLNHTHCDLFTAPTVAWDPVSGDYTVRRLGEVPPPPAIVTAAPVAVTRAQPKPFRIQLLGHIGDGADRVGTFADLATGTTFLARAGQTVLKAAIAVRTLERVRRNPDAADAVSRFQGWVTVAEVEDLRTGETKTLTDESREENEVMP